MQVVGPDRRDPLREPFSMELSEGPPDGTGTASEGVRAGQWAREDFSFSRSFSARASERIKIHPATAPRTKRGITALRPFARSGTCSLRVVGGRFRRRGTRHSCRHRCQPASAVRGVTER
ncbi:hypothetical protein GCM10010433_27190 [Streptomyces pulveraceus]